MYRKSQVRVRCSVRPVSSRTSRVSVHRAVRVEKSAETTFVR
ncbi:hypothetical protein [Saccharopolyspora erythraea]|nr:hypothetical protein [Saccharopolyspora erythraea]